MVLGDREESRWTMETGHEGQHAYQAQRLRELIEEVGRRPFVATSPDGLIKVSAVATGQVVDLEISPRVYRNTNSKGLARSILDTLNSAISGASAMHVENLSRASGIKVDNFGQLFENATSLVAELMDEVNDSK
ncbi:YbaB/EbfC family nucleoid-associated protein [Actinomadura viridis]|uniref:YbaB/EbfC family nucleoid-associated protein n=1 Tax=Actinomadura viridis TaxID=58110 RepID=UPI0036B16E53